MKKILGMRVNLAKDDFKFATAAQVMAVFPVY
jgi:hypothetical protein